AAISRSWNSSMAGPSGWAGHAAVPRPRYCFAAGFCGAPFRGFASDFPIFEPERVLRYAPCPNRVVGRRWVATPLRLRPALLRLFRKTSFFVALVALGLL